MMQTPMRIAASSAVKVFSQIRRLPRLGYHEVWSTSSPQPPAWPWAFGLALVVIRGEQPNQRPRHRTLRTATRASCVLSTAREY